MDTNQNYLRVITPKMESACINTDFICAPVKLKALTIDSTSVQAPVAAISVDDHSLASSKRILLVYATDVLASNMVFTSQKQETIVNGRSAPALVRTGKLAVRMDNSSVSQATAWALGFDGKRLEQLPVTAHSSRVEFAVDTEKLKNGPSAYS